MMGEGFWKLMFVIVVLALLANTCSDSKKPIRDHLDEEPGTMFGY